jgi:ABC-type antimicrobial peptide transport system permease subunit
VIINASLATKAFPNGGAVGKRLAIGAPGPRQRFFQVVGVVADSRSLALDAPDGPVMFTTYTQFPPFQIGLLVRTKGDPASFETPVTKTVQAIEPDQPVFAVATMDALLGDDVSQRRYAAAAVAIFAALAMTLSGIGVYGLIAFMVSQRTRELGLRMALGSSPRAALTLVFSHGFRLTLIGAAIGLAVAVVGAGLVRSMVYGVTLHDPVAFGVAPLILLAIAAVACWAPARRAAAIDPIRALRME